MSLPDFWLTDLSDSDFTKFTPPGSTRQDTVVVALRQDRDNLLAIRFIKKIEILYSPGKTPSKVENGPYSAQPFLELIQTMRSWSERGSPNGPVAGAATGGDGNTAIQRVLDRLSVSYLACRGKLALWNPLPAGGIEASYYNLGKFEVDAEMRLKKDGSLSGAPEEEYSRLQLRLRVDGSAQPQGRVLLAPAGLVASGILYDSFFESLEFDAGVFLADQMGSLIRESSLEFRLMRAQEFVRSARADSTIMIAGFGNDAPLYLLTLRGSLYYLPTTLLLLAEFRTISPTSVSLNPDGQHASIAGFAGDPDGVEIDRADIGFIVLPIQNIKHWAEVL